MKKTILAVIAAALIAIPAVNAQKVNEKSLTSKIEKSDAEIADPAKNGKAATWINRGRTMYEAATAPVKDIFIGMDSETLRMNVGSPESTGQEQILGGTYDALVFPYFTIYFKDGKSVAWRQTKWIDKDAVTKSIEAYKKAYELDPKSGDKIKTGLALVSNFCTQQGNVTASVGEYRQAAEAYQMAYDAESCPAYGTAADASLLYYAGHYYTIDGAKNPGSLAKGATALEKALAAGYTDPDGMIYYFLFHCYYGQKDADPANVMKSRDALLTGIKKFPKNEPIMEALTQLYTSEKDLGNPADLIDMIDKSIAEHPDNVDLLLSRGRLFYALKNTDEALASFRKITEIKPDLFEGNYYTGLFSIVKADELNQEVSSRPYTSAADSAAGVAAVNAAYAEALPWLEKALAIKPNDLSTIENLKSLTFRLRDEPGMQEKYDKYNAMWKAAQEQPQQPQQAQPAQQPQKK